MKITIKWEVKTKIYIKETYSYSKLYNFKIIDASNLSNQSHIDILYIE